MHFQEIIQCLKTFLHTKIPCGNQWNKISEIVQDQLSVSLLLAMLSRLPTNTCTILINAHQLNLFTTYPANSSRLSSFLSIISSKKTKRQKSTPSPKLKMSWMCYETGTTPKSLCSGPEYFQKFMKFGIWNPKVYSTSKTWLMSKSHWPRHSWHNYEQQTLHLCVCISHWDIRYTYVSPGPTKLKRLCNSWQKWKNTNFISNCQLWSI